MVSTMVSKWCEMDFVHPQYVVVAGIGPQNRFAVSSLACQRRAGSEPAELAEAQGRLPTDGTHTHTHTHGIAILLGARTD